MKRLFSVTHNCVQHLLVMFNRYMKRNVNIGHKQITFNDFQLCGYKHVFINATEYTMVLYLSMPLEKLTAS